MIKAIVYDLDGMVFIEPHYFTEELELKYEIPLKESLFSKDSKYEDCKKGEISLDEFLFPYYRKWQKYPKFTLSFKESKKEWFDFAKVNKSIFDIAKKLKKKGVINVILTNNTKERVEYLIKKFDLLDIFEIIGSYEVGLLKPDPKFYDVFLKKYKLNPQEVLIFDDKEDTVDYLISRGFKAEIYSGIKEFLYQLIKYKINVN